MLALEDDFSDIIGKAMRGLSLAPADLAERLVIEESAVGAWLTPGVPVALSARMLTMLAHELALDAPSLAASANQKWHPQTQLPKYVASYVQLPQPSNGYLVWNGSVCAVVDPAGALERILAALTQLGGRLQYILITHRHNDHCDAATALAAVFPAATLAMNASEHAAAPAVRAANVRHVKNENLSFGDAVITTRIVGGHTDGLTCYQFRDALFVGDALFAGSVGRCFGPMTTYAQQLKNLQADILALPPEITILPGHGPPTTVANERRNNPFLAGKYRISP